jgi:hypothetical protein
MAKASINDVVTREYTIHLHKRVSIEHRIGSSTMGCEGNVECARMQKF